MTNDMFSGIIFGIGIAIALVGLFQIGVNIGLKTAINMLDGNYPAAMTYLTKHKQSGKVLPYIINQINEVGE